MVINLKRIADNGNASIGVLYINDEFQCFVVEDEQRSKKVYGETRIPEGVYNIGLRSEGRYHNIYKKRYTFHKGMLCLYNKPDWVLENKGLKFQYILIHTGNTEKHTAGCLLLNDVINKDFVGSYSAQSYKRIYPIIALELAKGNEVKIIVQ